MGGKERREIETHTDCERENRRRERTQTSLDVQKSDSVFVWGGGIWGFFFMFGLFVFKKGLRKSTLISAS